MTPTKNPGGRPVLQHAFAPPLALDRLVRKEVSLGALREYEPPTDHIGLQLLAPYLDVEADDVIFDYIPGLSTGLAPARAEDSESEMSQKDEFVGYGRASVIDWALKDHYRPSDVSRYREALLLRENQGSNSFPLTINRMIDGFQQRLARDEALRRAKLDNRMEWLIMQAINNGTIVYNDGKIKFTVDFGRPAGNTAIAPVLWSQATSDPIADISSIQEDALEKYGVTIDRAIGSRKAIRSVLNTNKYQNNLIGDNPLYTVQGWGPEAAKNIVQNQTNLTFIEYDAVYRTRALGSQTFVNQRFLPDDSLFFLPSTQDVDSLQDGLGVGFGATLTSPHPEGNWTSGFYEWERETVDPWSHDRGTGIKAFPVFPFMELTYRLKVL